MRRYPGTRRWSHDSACGTTEPRTHTRRSRPQETWDAEGNARRTRDEPVGSSRACPREPSHEAAPCEPGTAGCRSLPRHCGTGRRPIRRRCTTSLRPRGACLASLCCMDRRPAQSSAALQSGPQCGTSSPPRKARSCELWRPQALSAHATRSGTRSTTGGGRHALGNATLGTGAWARSWGVKSC